MSTDTAAHLKPCPFCGGDGEPRSNHDVGNAWVECVRCLAQSGGFQEAGMAEHILLDHAVKEWNRRASALPAAPMPGVRAIEVSIKPMRLSDDRCDYFVSFKCGDREVTPHVFRERFKAEYHVAEYRWLFGQGPKPGIMEFRPDEWPAREFTAEEQRAFASLSALDVPAHPEGVKALTGVQE